MNRLYLSHANLISRGLAKTISIIVFSIFTFDTLLFPLPTLADFKAFPKVLNNRNAINTSETRHLPQNTDKIYKIKYSKYTTITAYNSIPGQTDDSPCITANGFNVCKHNTEDTIAVNFLKFGTKVRIPEIFGDRIFVVRDRMHKRYTNRVDIWMINKADAIKLGKRLAKIEVLE